MNEHSKGIAEACQAVAAAARAASAVAARFHAAPLGLGEEALAATQAAGAVAMAAQAAASSAHAAAEAATTAAAAEERHIRSLALTPTQPYVEDEWHLSKKVHDHLKKCAGRFEKSVKSFVRTKDLVEKLTTDVETMKKDKSRYPPGIRPYRAATAIVEMDEALLESIEGEYTFAITIPQGSTMREAAALIHHEAALKYREYELRSMMIRRENLKQQSTKEYFFNLCNSYEEEKWDDLGWRTAFRGASTPA